jgi:hypothetical protein
MTFKKKMARVSQHGAQADVHRSCRLGIVNLAIVLLLDEANAHSDFLSVADPGAVVGEGDPRILRG